MPDTYEEALRVLGLEPGASEQAIKDAYRDLVKVWHPDRFGSDARLREKAQDKLKEVNAAFEQLRGYRASDVRRPRPPAPPREAPSDVRESHVPRADVEPANHARTRYGMIFLLCAALTAIGAMGLFMSRGPVAAPQQPFPAPEVIQEPPAPPSPAPVSPVRQPVKRAPEAPPSREVDAARQPAPAPATGSLIVTSRPVGAHVSFDGRVVGDTPIVVTDVTPGEHRVELTLDGNGYQPWSSSVVVAAGREEKLLAVLTPTGRAPTPGGKSKH